MAFFKLDLLTPNGSIVKNFDCDSVSVSTTSGEIEILPEHYQYLTELDTGTMTVKTGNEKRFFSITHGICKVIGKKISILSLTSEAAESIDQNRALQAKKNAELKLQQGNLTNIEQIKYQRKLQRAEARIKLGYLR